MTEIRLKNIKRREPISLNERFVFDAILGDSMAAALFGHPGAYYTTVRGGELGNLYTAEAIVYPPSKARWFTDSNFFGLGELLIQIAWDSFTLQEPDPDAMYGLDYDNMNLDFLLLTNELFGYNEKPDYSFSLYNEESDKYYERYARNTLNYLEQLIAVETQRELDRIKIISANARPEYIFVDSSTQENQLTLPETSLYQPIVVSQERYKTLSDIPQGHLSINIEMKGMKNTRGLNMISLNSIEKQLGYQSKIPLNTQQFKYPISKVVLQVVKEDIYGGSITVISSETLETERYAIDSGNLYLYQKLGKKNIGIIDNMDSVYYRIMLTFDLVIPASLTRVDQDEKSRRAFIQAYQYALMEYMAQYTFSRTTATMIGEIAYTQVMTLASTAISAPFVVLGSWATSSLSSQLTKMSLKQVAKSIAIQTISSPVEEMFEEIMIDSSMESIIQNWFSMTGVSEVLGFWVSSLATSARESFGSLARTARGSIQQARRQHVAEENLVRILAQDGYSEAEIAHKKQTESFKKLVKVQAQSSAALVQQERSKLRKIFSSGLFKSILYSIPSIFLGGFSIFSLFAFKSLIGGAASVGTNAIGKHFSFLQASKQGCGPNIEKLVEELLDGETPVNNFVDNIRDSMQKPSYLNGENINKLFKGQTEDVMIQQPVVNIFPTLNDFNEDLDSPRTLIDDFDYIRFKSWIEALLQEERFKSQKEIFKQKLQNIRKNKKIIDFKSRVKEIEEIIFKCIKIHSPKDLRYTSIYGFLDYDPTFVLLGIPHYKPHQEIAITLHIPIKELVKILEQKYYIGFDIDLFIIKGGNMVFIDPESEEDPSKWLDKQGYSKHQEIYIKPSQEDFSGPIYNKKLWKKGTTSPFTLHFDKLRRTLRRILFESNLISEYSYTAASKFFFPHEVREGFIYLKDTYSKLNTGKNFDIQEPTLISINARITNALLQQYESDIISQNAYEHYISQVKNLFEEQFMIYGYTTKNQFYNLGRRNILQIGNLLQDKEIIERNSFTAIYRFVKDFGGSRTAITLEHYKNKLNRVPNKGTYESLRDAFRDAIDSYASTNSKFTESDKEILFKEIRSLIREIIEKIVVVKYAQDLFGDIEECARKDLLVSIYSSHPVFKYFTTKKSFSQLLFGEEDYISNEWFLKRRLHSRPEVFLLHRITHNIFKWTLDDFDGKISARELNKIKKETDKRVYDWIFSNPNEYDKKYINEAPYRFGKTHDKFFLAREYRLMQALTYSVSEKSGEKPIGWELVLNELGINILTMKNLLTDGHIFASIRDLRIAQKTIKKWLKKDLNNIIYKNALNEIDLYIAERLLGVTEEKKRTSRGYDELWNDPRIMAYHVIVLLYRNLGFDPLSFKDLNPDFFDKDVITGLYARHHMHPSRKWSVYMSDSILTDNSFHSEYDRISSRHQEILLKIIRDLINSKSKEINSREIIQTFLNNFNNPADAKFYLENYWMGTDFKKRLSEFNKRRDALISGQFEQFLRNNYEVAYERFYDDAKEVIDGLSALSSLEDFKLSRIFSWPDIYFLRRYFNI
ncbi:MAG: hypothetical protein BAJALOKI2v1_30007 [Promethearchaeota archaeon]|nr:MAG: hypothetical protein BAJALOKI2v1_30007 [Candidatus Lokiarchaeota archaeon]